MEISVTKEKNQHKYYEYENNNYNNNHNKCNTIKNDLAFSQLLKMTLEMSRGDTGLLTDAH